MSETPASWKKFGKDKPCIKYCNLSAVRSTLIVLRKLLIVSQGFIGLHQF